MYSRVLLLFLVLGCSTIEEDLNVAPGGQLPAHAPDPVYDELFPTYIELCAVSQFRTLDGQVGGIPGHCVMFLHGACRDTEADYPQLRPCTEHDGPKCGVGVSVNRWTDNVNWLAFPGRDLFLYGNLGPDDRVDQAAVDAAVAAVLDAGVLDGVVLKEYPLPDGLEPSLENFVRRESLGTDFAITFARTVLSVRVPVTEPMLEEIVVFLNDLNRQYAEGTAEYDWNGYNDNCAHAHHNALAAASIWEPKTVAHFKSDLAIPSNEVLKLALLTTEFPIDDLEKAFGDPVVHDALLEFGWLPGRHGALACTLDVHPDNDLYDPAFRLFVLESLGSDYVHEAEKLFDDERFYDVETNLRWYEDIYRRILAERPAEEGEMLRGDRKWAFRRRYYKYIEEQYGELQDQLARLEASSDPAAGP